LNPGVLERYYLCDYRLGLRSLAVSGLNCCRVVGGDCGYIQCEGEIEKFSRLKISIIKISNRLSILEVSILKV